jgi:predicted nuclease with RNAse H fold
MNSIGIGIDLAGYSTQKTAVAIAHREGASAHVTIDRDHPLRTKRAGGNALREVANEEAEYLRECLEMGRVFVDVPIDLQGLTRPDTANVIWELYQRPVDRAFRALSPVADRLGGPVRRFAQIVSRLRTTDLGTRLFETYPAASIQHALRLDTLDRADATAQSEDETEDDVRIGMKPGYKGSVIMLEGSTARARTDKATDNVLAQLARAMRLQSSEAITLTDDDVDAILCALAAVAASDELLQGPSLETMIRENLPPVIDSTPPSGYAILRQFPWEAVHVLVKHEIAVPNAPLPQGTGKELWENAARLLEENGHAAVAQAIRDYRNKAGTKGGWDSWLRKNHPDLARLVLRSH